MMNMAHTFKHLQCATFDNATLIEKVKARPILWNPTFKTYCDKQARYNAWEEICSELDTCWASASPVDKFAKVTELRKKWSNLRDYYRKECRRSAVDGLQSRLYRYFDSMKFLHPYFTMYSDTGAQRKKRVKLYDTAKSDEDDSLEDYRQLESDDTVIKAETVFHDPNDFQESDPKNDEYIMLSENNSDTRGKTPFLVNASFQNGHVTNNSNGDALEHLFQYYAKTVKTFSAKRQIETKRLINEIIHNMEVAENEERDSDKMTLSFSTS